MNKDLQLFEEIALDTLTTEFPNAKINIVSISQGLVKNEEWRWTSACQLSAYIDNRLAYGRGHSNLAAINQLIACYMSEPTEPEVEQLMW